jgi:hypothetical protein
LNSSIPRDQDELAADRKEKAMEIRGFRSSAA